ncbi:MAG: hypothetical protein ACOCP8_09730 [archaeon]
MSNNLAQKYNFIQKNITINYLKDIYPSFNNLKEERDLSGFAMFLGQSIANNPELEDLNNNGFYNNWREDYYILNDIIENLHISEEVDSYYTANFFKGFTYSKFLKIKRNDDCLMWLTSLFIDIDGIEEVYTVKEAKKVLLNAFKKAGIKEPNFIIHTSTNPTVRVQLLWLLDPMYLKDDNNTLIVDRISWWKDSARSIIYKLKQVEPRLNIDEGASTNPKGYLRLPGSINQKTNEIVTIIHKNITDKRYTLEDNWLNDLRKVYYKYLKQIIHKSTKKKNYMGKRLYNTRQYKSDIALLEHPQIKILLDNGVPKGYRNKAVYALTKACLADGLSFEETVKVIEKFNNKCKPANAFGELLYWIKASYGLIGCEKKALKNIDPVKVKTIVNDVFGTNFKADNVLYLAFRRRLYRNKEKTGEIRGTYISKKETISRTVAVISSYILTGNSKLPNQRKLALIAGVKYNSIVKKSYWKEIKKQLYIKFGIVIKVVGQANKLMIQAIENDLFLLNMSYFMNLSLLCKITYNKKSIIWLVIVLLYDCF